MEETGCGSYCGEIHLLRLGRGYSRHRKRHGTRAVEAGSECGSHSRSRLAVSPDSARRARGGRMAGYRLPCPVMCILTCLPTRRFPILSFAITKPSCNGSRRRVGVPAQLRMTPSLLSRSNVDLVFDGLDGPATVYLNNAPPSPPGNSFRTWRIPAKASSTLGRTNSASCLPRPSKPPRS